MAFSGRFPTGHWPEEVINEGHVECHNNCVKVFQDRYTGYSMQVPAGNIRDAYWQGNNIHIVMEDGWHYVYNDFYGTNKRSWKQ